MRDLFQDTSPPAPQSPIQHLQQNIDKLPAGDRAFAKSLWDQFSRKGALSDKQWVWVEKLNASILGIGDPVLKVSIGPVDGIVALFKKAAPKLKYPKVTLRLPDGKAVVFSVAGAQSRFPSSIVVNDGRPYRQGFYYGRILLDGNWMPARVVADDTAAAVHKLLCDFAAEPAKVAADQGKLTGHCCFCNSELSDAKSTRVGYGPHCAKVWGMPWGNKA